MVLCGGETWFLNLREEYRLRMSETKVMSKMCERTGKEKTGGRRQLRNEVRDL